MSEVNELMQELTACEKMWLLAGELLRDEGIEEVTAQHLAELLGQTLSCVAIHDTLCPLDQKSVASVLERATSTASQLHAEFVKEVLKHK